jgi:hypothetical protein
LTPLSPVSHGLPLGLAHPWGKPQYREREGMNGHVYAYSESDVRSERR